MGKGQRGELGVAKLLAPWWAQVEPATKFVRTPRSGGWASAGEFRASGDVMVTPGSAFPWSVEVKRREAWSPRRFLAGDTSPVWGWWRQTCEAAATTGLSPMLWARRNNGLWLVAVEAGPLRGPALPGERVVNSLWGPQGPDGVAMAVYRGAEFLATDPAVWLRLIVG